MGQARADQGDTNECWLYALADCTEWQLNSKWFVNGNWKVDDIAEQTRRALGTDPHECYRVMEICEKVNAMEPGMYLNFTQTAGEEKPVQLGCRIKYECKPVSCFAEAVQLAHRHELMAIVPINFITTDGKQTKANGEVAAGGLHLLAAEIVVQEVKGVPQRKIMFKNSWGGKDRVVELTQRTWADRTIRIAAFHIVVTVIEPSEGLRFRPEVEQSRLTQTEETTTTTTMPSPPSTSTTDRLPPYDNELRFTVTESTKPCVEKFKEFWPMKAPEFFAHTLDSSLRMLERMSSSSPKDDNNNFSKAMLFFEKVSEKKVSEKNEKKDEKKDDQEQMPKTFRPVKGADGAKVETTISKCRDKTTSQEFCRRWLKCMETSPGPQYQEEAVRRFLQQSGVTDEPLVNEVLQTLAGMPKEPVWVSPSGKMLWPGITCLRIDFSKDAALAGKAWSYSWELSGERSKWFLVEMSAHGLHCYYPYEINCTHQAHAWRFPKRYPLMDAVIVVLVAACARHHRIDITIVVNALVKQLHKKYRASGCSSIPEMCELWNCNRISINLDETMPAGLPDTMRKIIMQCQEVTSFDEAADHSGTVVIFIRKANLVILTSDAERRQQAKKKLPPDLVERCTSRGFLPMEIQAENDDDTFTVKLLPDGDEVTLPEVAVDSISYYTLLREQDENGDLDGLVFTNTLGCAIRMVELTRTNWDDMTRLCEIETFLLKATAEADTSNNEDKMQPDAAVEADDEEAKEEANEEEEEANDLQDALPVMLAKAREACEEALQARGGQLVRVELGPNSGLRALRDAAFEEDEEEDERDTVEDLLLAIGCSGGEAMEPEKLARAAELQDRSLRIMTLELTRESATLRDEVLGKSEHAQVTLVSYTLNGQAYHYDWVQEQQQQTADSQHQLQ